MVKRPTGCSSRFFLNVNPPESPLSQLSRDVCVWFSQPGDWNDCSVGVQMSFKAPAAAAIGPFISIHLPYTAVQQLPPQVPPRLPSFTPFWNIYKQHLLHFSSYETLKMSSHNSIFLSVQMRSPDRGSLPYNFGLNLEAGWKLIAGWVPSLWAGLKITTLSQL